ALAAFFQGVILGGLVHGVEVRDGQYAGGAFDWLTPFNLLCGVAVATGYALLGATWLVMKTEGFVAARARRQAKLLLLFVLACMAAVSLWTPLSSDRIAERWFSWPNILYLSPVPIVTAGVALLVWRALELGSEVTPFLGAIGLFLLGFLGLAISTFPYVIPPQLTIWQASAPPSTQAFMLAGVAVLLPIVLGYMAFVYWIFRGKIRPGEGYH
ncbi:MAG: cytochrome d ubiquinol oxidase subunit II, partial [Chloroflexota bacterium]|nr:cytochrome d ubiquinol oxidase subunit II [Chloroflexota bacterium]